MTENNTKILAKIHAVMCDVEYIQKDKVNQHHGYSYASELAIKQALGAAFRKHSIVFQLETMEASTLPVELGKYDKAGDVRMSTIAKCRYTFWDVASGESLSGEFMSSGPARDDKGLWAATTNAIKYILTSTFLIPTGDDAESDVNHPAPQPKAAKETRGKQSAPKSVKGDLVDAIWKRLGDLGVCPELDKMSALLVSICESKAGADGGKQHAVTQDQMLLAIGNKKVLPDAKEWSAMLFAFAKIEDDAVKSLAVSAGMKES